MQPDRILQRVRNDASLPQTVRSKHTRLACGRAHLYDYVLPRRHKSYKTNAGSALPWVRVTHAVPVVHARYLLIGALPGLLFVTAGL